jgi:hypothetical protein
MKSESTIKFIFQYQLLTIRLAFTLSLVMIIQSISAVCASEVSYSFFAEGGQTESVFVIDGRNFPVKIGSAGLKATMSPSNNFDLYGKVGFGYSQKQSVSAFDFNLSGSVLAASVGVGVNKKFPIGNSNFVLMPFFDISSFNYSSDTFRGERNSEKLKATVKGKSSFARGGIELQYLTQNGKLFFGTGLNNWDIENEISIRTDKLTITPRVWADKTDSFFQAGVVFKNGRSDTVVGLRMSDLTFDINTQLIEVFAETQVSFGQ